MVVISSRQSFSQDSLSHGGHLTRTVFHQGCHLIKAVFDHGGHLIKVAVSSGQPLIRAVFHQSGHPSGCSFIRVVTHQGALSSKWSPIRVLFHQSGHPSGCSFIKVVTRQAALSSEWSPIRVLFHQVVLSFGSAVTGILVLIYRSWGHKSKSAVSDLLFLGGVVLVIYIVYKSCLAPNAQAAAAGADNSHRPRTDMGGDPPPPYGFRPDYMPGTGKPL